MSRERVHLEVAFTGTLRDNLAAMVAKNDADMRAELRDRLDRCDPFDHEAALREIAHRDPDLVNDVLDQNGAKP